MLYIYNSRNGNGWKRYKKSDKMKLLYFNLNLIDDNSGLLVALGLKITKEVHSAKFFGLLIDNQLTWKQHINSIC